MMANNRCRSASCASSVGNSSGHDEGSSTICAKITARAAANGRRAHHRWSVEGCPCRIDFSRAEALLMASSGSATSISFLRVLTVTCQPQDSAVRWRTPVPTPGAGSQANFGRDRCRRAPRPRASCARTGHRGGRRACGRARPWRRAAARSAAARSPPPSCARIRWWTTPTRSGAGRWPVPVAGSSSWPEQPHSAAARHQDSRLDHPGDAGVLGLRQLFGHTIIALGEPRLLEPGKSPASVSIEVALLLGKSLVESLVDQRQRARTVSALPRRGARWCSGYKPPYPGR